MPRRRLRSEIAKSQGWQAVRGKRFDSGLTCIPAKATQLVIAARLDLESMHPAWEAAVVEFPAAPSLEDIKQHFGGLDDMIANTSAVRVADDSYVVRFSDQIFGVPSGPAIASWSPVGFSSPTWSCHRICGKCAELCGCRHGSHHGD